MAEASDPQVNACFGHSQGVAVIGYAAGNDADDHRPFVGIFIAQLSPMLIVYHDHHHRSIVIVKHIDLDPRAEGKVTVLERVQEVPVVLDGCTRGIDEVVRLGLRLHHQSLFRKGPLRRFIEPAETFGQPFPLQSSENVDHVSYPLRFALHILGSLQESSCRFSK